MRFMKPNLFNHLNTVAIDCNTYVRSFQVPSANNAHFLLNLSSVKILILAELFTCC